MKATPKLRTGAKVRVIDRNNWMGGLTAKVLSVNDDTVYLQFRGGISGGFPLGQVEPITPKQPKAGQRQAQLQFTG